MSSLAQVTLHDLDTLRTDTSIVAVQPSEASHATPQRTPEEMLAEYSNALHRTALRFRNWRYTGGDTLSNPYYFYVFSSPTFYEGPMHQRLGRLSYKPQTSFGTRTSIYDGSLAQHPRLDMTEDALAYIYTTRPWYVRHMDTETMPSPTAGEQTPVRPHVNLTEKVERTPENPAPQIVEQPDIEVHRPNFWNLSAEASFQLIQNYVSDNWYKGGESNHSLLASIILQANYNNKQKLRWDNKLEMKLGFQSSNSDEQHKKESWEGEDNNPYEMMPRMVLMTYQLPELLERVAKEGEFDEFDLNEFFAADIPEGGDHNFATFRHEDEVQKWLDLIRGAYRESIKDDLTLRNEKPPMPFSRNTNAIRRQRS